MGPGHLPVLGLPEHQIRAAKKLKDKEKERARNEALTADATPDATTGATKIRKYPAATISTTPRVSPGYIFSDAPGPLPSVYGTILTSGRC